MTHEPSPAAASETTGDVEASSESEVSSMMDADVEDGDQELSLDDLGDVSGGACVAGSFSDLRLKEDVHALATTNGLKLYRFRYKDDPLGTEWVGVMAQDLLASAVAVHRSAVHVGADGYYRVNYPKLGIRMQPYSVWSEQDQNPLL